MPIEIVNPWTSTRTHKDIEISKIRLTHSFINDNIEFKNNIIKYIQTLLIEQNKINIKNVSDNLKYRLLKLCELEGINIVYYDEDPLGSSCGWYIKSMSEIGLLNKYFEDVAFNYLLSHEMGHHFQ